MISLSEQIVTIGNCGALLTTNNYQETVKINYKKFSPVINIINICNNRVTKIVNESVGDKIRAVAKGNNKTQSPYDFKNFVFSLDDFRYTVPRRETNALESLLFQKRCYRFIFHLHNIIRLCI